MEDKIYIFGDKAIEKIDQDKFSAITYVNILKKIIKSLLDRNEPFNIGIFGKWGTGKTSIINLFKDDIEKDPQLKNQVKLVDFNVWKYSGGSLRRQFLIFLDSQKGLNTELNVQKELDRSKQEVQTRFKFSLRYLLASLVLGAIIFILLRSVASQILDPTVQLLVALLVTALLVVFDVLKKGVARIEEITETVHRLDRPDQFERKFKEIIEKAQEKGKWKKIIVVFDDLDRCTTDKVIEMLGMFKTFFEEDTCIYIIPSDDEAIKKHLSGIRKYEGKEADEFLKKFFQITFRIPPFIEEDIFNYTHELAENAYFEKDVEKVIISAFWENPRQIKQFLNKLTASTVLAREKESRRLIEENRITGNLPFLAKIEAVREKWPSVIDELNKDKSFLEILEGTIYGRESPNIPNEKIEKARGILNNDPDLRNFLNANMDVQDPDPSIFIKLGQPTYLSTLKDVDELELRAISGDVDFIKEKFIETDKKQEFVKALFDILQKRLDSVYYDQAFNILRTMVEVYPKIDDAQIKNDVANKVTEKLALGAMRPRVKYLPLPETFDILMTAKPDWSRETLRHFVEVVGEV